MTEEEAAAVVADLRARSKRAFDSLTPKEQRILRMRFGLGPDDEAGAKRWAKRMKRLSEEDRPKSELLEAITKRAKSLQND